MRGACDEPEVVIMDEKRVVRPIRSGKGAGTPADGRGVPADLAAGMSREVIVGWKLPPVVAKPGRSEDEGKRRAS